jgi:hypothetical protein
MASTGKLQRDPATGKIMRSSSGKALRADDVDNACCCTGGGGGGACGSCPDETPTRYTVTVSGITACCIDRGAGFGDDEGGRYVKVEGALDDTYCVYFLGSINGICYWACTVENPDINLVGFSDSGCTASLGSVQADYADIVFARLPDGSFHFLFDYVFENFPADGTISFLATTDPIELCNAPFTVDSELIADDCSYTGFGKPHGVQWVFGGSATVTPSDTCICVLGELCPDPCLACNDCPPYALTTTTLRLVLDGLSFGQCDDCAGGIDGTGCCVSEVPASDCKVCGGSPGIDCACLAVADKAECLANDWTWCCRGSSGTGTDGVSPCDNLPIDADVTLHITAHTATTQTFSATIGGTTYTVVHTCGTSHVASVFDVTVTAGSGGRCRMHGIIGGGCHGGAGSVFTFTDTGLDNGECAGNGQGHATISVHFGCCS